MAPIPSIPSLPSVAYASHIPAGGFGQGLPGGAVSITTPTSFWRLEEASGTRVDSGAGGNDLNLNNGTPGNAAGLNGNALSLVAASSQYVGIADNASLSMGTGVAFSFSGWVKLNALGTLTAIFAKGSTTEYGLFYINGSNVLQFYVTDGSGTSHTLNSSNTVSSGVWIFFAVTCDGNTSGTVTVNTTTATTASFAEARDLAGQFDIGSRLGSFPVDGLIDSVGFWKGHVLTAPEITALYNAGAGTEYYSGAWH
jgi:hypothetical protein